MALDEGFIFMIVLFIIGISLFILGFVWLHRRRLIHDLPTSKVRSLAMGLVEVAGKATPYLGKGDGLLTSPLTKRKCLYYRYTVEEYKKRGKSSAWVIISSGEKRQPFYIKDSTGKVLVDLNGSELALEKDFEFNTQMHKQPPQSVLDFLKSKNIGFETFLGLTRLMRFTEYVILPDESLFIIGTAGDNPHREEATAQKNTEDIMIQKGKAGIGSGFYFISDRKEKDVAKMFSGRIWGLLVSGTLLVAGSLTVILIYLNAI